MENKNIIAQLEQMPIDPEFKVIRPDRHGWRQLGQGSDRTVFEVPGEGKVLKIAIGPQIHGEITEEAQKFFLPYEEFKLKNKVRGGNDDQIRRRHTRVCQWAQIQEKVRLPESVNGYLDDPELDAEIFQRCLNKDFVQALIDFYGYTTEEVLEALSLMSCAQTNVSSSNWGYAADGRPVVFDYGRIVLESDLVPKEPELVTPEKGYF